jgi:glycerol uptake facilitator-like aquaporin
MSVGAWIGLAITVFFLGSGYARIKKERRSGVTHDYGHAVADSLLLLVSALLLAAVLALVVFLIGTHRHTSERGPLSRVCSPVAIGSGNDMGLQQHPSLIMEGEIAGQIRS